MSQDNVTVNREYKSSLFARIFSEPEAALSLYNSLNGSNYDDPSGLEINTIESVLYIGWKNDVSFLIGSDMNLYEHQATWNPNMPLRGLFYFADLYRGYVSSRSLDIYAGVPLKLPAPRYTVFYNGTREEPESLELRLSSLFMKKDGVRAEEAASEPSGLFPKKDGVRAGEAAAELSGLFSKEDGTRAETAVPEVSGLFPKKDGARAEAAVPKLSGLFPEKDGARAEAAVPELSGLFPKKDGARAEAAVPEVSGLFPKKDEARAGEAAPEVSGLFPKKDGVRAGEAAPEVSGLFPKKDGVRAEEIPPALECTAQVLNINFGHNRGLMERCRKLYEYSYFIDAVRRHLREGLTLGAALDRAADECIAGDILREFLLKHRAEVANMVMPEFDAELHDRTTREIGYNEGYDEGRAAGIAEGIAEGRTAGIAEGRTAGIAEGRTAGIAEGRTAGIAEGRAAGIAEGIAEGKAGTVCDMLSDVGLLPEVWRERIMAERDIDTLDIWIRTARRAGSLEEFLAKAGLET